MRSSEAKKKAFFASGLILLMGSMVMIVIIVAPVSEDDPDKIRTLAAMQTIGAMTEGNYFTRKIGLAKAWRLTNHLSHEHPDYMTKDTIALQHTITDRLFSREEWLGF